MKKQTKHEVKVRGKLTHSPQSVEVQRLSYRFNYPNYKITQVTPEKPDVRKNQSAMTQDEKNRFLAAYQSINSPAILGTMVSHHADMTHQMHSHPRFLPWHRVYLAELEEMLQAVDPEVTIPYWDWTKDANVPNWLQSFTPTIVLPNGTSIIVTRTPGVLTPNLPPQQDVDAVMAETTYDEFNDALEGGSDTTQTGMHNTVHVWVGGAMGIIRTAPADVLFWMHHCMCDRIWYLWQKDNPNVNPNLPGPLGIMDPWTVTEEQTRDTLTFGYIYG